MARKKVHRELPALEEAVPNFQGFRANEIKLNALKKILRRLATQCRTARGRPFYSAREIATYFQMSVSGVVKVFEQLETEGLLIRRRSSVTEISPLKGYKRVIHRGIVAIPIWMPGFVSYRELRQFFIALEKELLRFGFVSNLIFYRQSEELDPDFVRQMLAHKPDYVVWLRPAPSDESAVEMLGDAGVRLIVVGESGDRPLRGLRYRLDRDAALRACFRDWKRSGITSVVVPLENGERRSTRDHLPGRIAVESGLECRYPTPGRASLSSHVAEMARHAGTGFLFEEDLWHTSLCAQAPQAVGELVRQRRTLLLHPLNIAPIHLAEGSVDVVSFDFLRVAAEIAGDLDSGRVFSSREPSVFQAEWKSRVDAAGMGLHLANM